MAWHLILLFNFYTNCYFNHIVHQAQFISITYCKNNTQTNILYLI